jgi:sugar phosphate isomerase/epimerase
MKTRRTFLKQTGSAAAASFMLPMLDLLPAKNINAGVQLYTVRTEMLKDARGTLKKLAALGYKQIESAGSDKGYYYGLTPTEMKQVCKDLGLTLRSGHIQLDDKWQQTMNDAVDAGQEYLICSSMPKRGQTVDNYKKTADIFNKAGEESKKLKLKFGYHNHDYEFEQENGKTLYDVLVEETEAGFVHLELDLGWVVAAGKDPLDYFTRYPGRFPLWHLKDMDVAKKKSTEFGKGKLAIKSIMSHAKQSGMKYFFVEQEEYAGTPLEALEHNMKYLKTI